jgi:predicted NUDIX family NTP pyrophosphohydrolase
MQVRIGAAPTDAAPQADWAGWFSIDTARGKLIEGQRGFLDSLVGALLAR